MVSQRKMVSTSVEESRRFLKKIQLFSNFFVFFRDFWKIQSFDFPKDEVSFAVKIEHNFPDLKIEQLKIAENLELKIVTCAN